jgi:hypothetical protein
MFNFLKWLEAIAMASLTISCICLLWKLSDETTRIYLSVGLVTALLVLIAGSCYRWQLSRELAVGVFSFWIYALSGFVLALLGNYLRVQP